MICQNTGNIPRTLLSRACRVSFSPLKSEQVASVLADMRIENSKELAKISNGSIGYALYLNERDGINIFNKLFDAFSSKIYALCGLNRTAYHKQFRLMPWAYPWRLCRLWEQCISIHQIYGKRAVKSNDLWEKTTLPACRHPATKYDGSRLDEHAVGAHQGHIYITGRTMTQNLLLVSGGTSEQTSVPSWSPTHCYSLLTHIASVYHPHLLIICKFPLFSREIAPFFGCVR